MVNDHRDVVGMEAMLSPVDTKSSSPQYQSCDQPSQKTDGTAVQQLGETYRDNCFVCEDCHKVVADKFYLVESPDGMNDSVFVCEQHYYARLGLNCKTCHEPILEPVEPGLEYHPHCLQCAECIANEQQSEDTSCFEHQGRAYCRYHFSLLSDTWCAGCNMAILKQFVEHHNHPKKRWHPECYMILKFWNVRLADFCLPNHDQRLMTADRLRESQNEIEKKIRRIWTDLSAFQESSATCISDMLLHVAGGAYLEGLRMAGQFVSHLDVLFSALDTIAMVKREELQCMDMAQSVCNQIVRFLHLLAQDGTVNYTKSDTSVTQELLMLVTAMAQNLKTLIYTGLTEALQLEYRQKVFGAVDCFLGKILLLENKRVWMAGRYWFKNEPIPIGYDSEGGNLCQRCTKSILGDCVKNGILLWHIACFACTHCHRHLIKEIHKARVGQSTSDHGAILLCNTCYNNDGGPIQDSPFIYSTRLDQFLDLVKTTLGRLFMASNDLIPDEKNTSRDMVALQDYETKINTSARKSKRQSSLLRLMNRSTRRQSTLGSVHLTHVKRADKPLHSRGQNPWPDTARRSASVRETQPRGRLGSIRRALTTNRKERRSLNGVFDRHMKSDSTKHLDQQPQRAAVYTIETPDPTITNSSFPPTPSTIVPQCPRLVDLNKMEDTVLRHIAAIYFETILPNQFSLDQLTSFIEPRRPSLWNKLMGHMRVAAHSKHDGHDGSRPRTFGVPLMIASRQRQGHHKDVIQDVPGSLAPCFSENALVPAFVRNCILALVRMDISQEGVFRKNGNIRELNEICDAIDNDQASLDYLNESPIQLAALLKRYLRELPEPLLTFKLYDLFMMSTRTKDKIKSKTILHLACCMLPKPHRDTAQLLFLFLRWVATFHDTNKMGVTNLARVIAPTVFYSSAFASNKELTEERQQSALDEITVVEMLIRYQEEFCLIPANLIPVLQDPRAVECLSDTKQALKYLEYFTHGSQAPPTSLARDGENIKYPFATFSRRSWLPGRQ